jgi:hypothetical protein
VPLLAIGKRGENHGTNTTNNDRIDSR